MSEPPGKAFARVYEENVDRVYAYVRYRGQAAGRSEELTRRTFELALASWGDFDARRGSVAAWLLGIAGELATQEPATGSNPGFDPAMVAAARAGGVEDPSDSAVEEERAPPPELCRALERLSPVHRELLALRFGARLPTDELAELRSDQSDDVEMALAAALARLEEELEAGDQGASGPAPATPRATIPSKMNPGAA